MKVQPHMLAATSSVHEEHQSSLQDTIGKLFKASSEDNFVVAETSEALQKRVVDLHLKPLQEDLDGRRTFVQQADAAEQFFLISIELDTVVYSSLQFVAFVSASLQHVVPDALENSRVDLECPESLDRVLRVQVLTRTLKTFPRRRCLIVLRCRFVDAPGERQQTKGFH